MTIFSPRRVAAVAAFSIPLAVVAVVGTNAVTSHASEAAGTSSRSAVESTDFGDLRSFASTLPDSSFGYGSDPWSGSFGSYGSYGGGYGGYSGGYGSGDDSTVSSGQTDATDASSSASTGVVMIDTVLDYDEGEAAGTGLVIGSDGLVVTNHHVVQGATSITVTTADGTEYSATVVGYDKTHDIAVLKLKDASGLATVTTSTAAVSQGEAVDAIGNAEGEGVLTDAAGSVLKTSVDIKVSDDEGGTEKLKNLIETSADVVPGDSGGALLDADGDVIGMDVAAASSNTSGGATTDEGFAIPIAQVMSIADQIIDGTAGKDVVIGDSAAIGIEVAEVRHEVLVEGVESDSAENAGLVAGDVLTGIDGTKVTTLRQLRRALAADEPGQSVTLTWTDQSGSTGTGTVTLIDAPIP